MPLIDAHCLKKERGSDSIERLSINSVGGKFANYYAPYSMLKKIFIVKVTFINSSYAKLGAAMVTRGDALRCIQRAINHSVA